MTKLGYKHMFCWRLGCLVIQLLSVAGCTEQPVVKHDRFDFERDPLEHRRDLKMSVTRIIHLPSLDLDVKKLSSVTS